MQLLCCILIAIFGKPDVVLGLDTWIITQLQWETEEMITTLQYGNILLCKEHCQTILQQKKKSQVFNRILGAILTNSGKFQAPDCIYMFI